jgi:hypothetical protein
VKKKKSSTSPPTNTNTTYCTKTSLTVSTEKQEELRITTVTTFELRLG